MSEHQSSIIYALNPALLGSIRDLDSLTIFGAGNPLQLPITVFQALMAFAEPRTAPQAFAVLDVDIELGEFCVLVEQLAERGLLRPHQPADDDRGLQHMLDASLMSDAAAIDRLAAAMRQGRAIVIPDALPSELAEQAHRDLCHSAHWAPSEGGHDFFHYRACGMDRPQDQSPTLAHCSQLFQSNATRRFMAELSGQDCAGVVSIAAAWYRPGEYALPHDDTAANTPRSVAFVWYLTKRWQREWGGSLFWCPTGQYIVPTFNTLVMFNVTPANLHFICPVAQGATERRLTLSGFWNRAEPHAPVAPGSPADFISPPAYGQPSPALGAVRVL
jgi:Rps23 Pro-64 3,4-dihydroxylase Tpa1-like proline 4-hydroxylase